MKKLMKIFVALICSLGLVSVAYSAQPEENKPQKKKQAPTAQHPPQPTTGHVTGAGAGPKKTSMGAYEGKKGQTSMGASQGQKGKKGQTPMEASQGQKAKKGQTPKEASQVQTGKAAKGGKVTGPGKAGEAATATTTGKTAAAGTAKAGKPLKAQKFNLPKQPNTAKAPPVKFQPNKHIKGSQNWQGQQYTVFRNYKSEWHDQNWWHSHHSNIVFVFGAPYYWNAGYWFPAWGYNPNAYYAWDGPIYGYNHLPPDQVIANAQAALQQQGYYQGEVDGLLGPLTRDAIANYQRDHGLYTTSTIDQPTLRSLGMA